MGTLGGGGHGHPKATAPYSRLQSTQLVPWGDGEGCWISRGNQAPVFLSSLG